MKFHPPTSTSVKAWVDPYRAPSIFLLKGLVQSMDHSGLMSERELKDPDNLLPHMKLAPQLL